MTGPASIPIIFNLFGDDRCLNEIANLTNGVIGEISYRPFPDGESYVRIHEDVFERDVILLTSLDKPNEKILPLLFAAKTLSNLGAQRIGLVTPYLPYMRQDTSFQTGEAVTGRQFANILSRDFDWMLTVDPHLHRVKDLSEIYVMQTQLVSAVNTVAAWIQENVKNPIIIGPDSESDQWASVIARTLNVPYVVARKDRCGDDCVEIELPQMNNHNGHIPVIADDIISTAGTMIETVIALKTLGAGKPVCIGIHALFDEETEAILRQSGAADVVTCTTIIHPTNQIDVSRCIAKGISDFIEVPFEKPFRRYV